MSAVSNNEPALLLLEDGTQLPGFAFGARGCVSGEICFNTGMTGYQEVFTDPSYTGQILIMNNCYIGNYGTRSQETESDSLRIQGLICKNVSFHYARKLAENSLENYLKDNGLVCIYGLDTRALVRHIRSKGAMNCLISSEGQDLDTLQDLLARTPRMEGLELSSRVSTRAVYAAGDPSASIRIAALDFGIKRNILQSLVERGAYIQVYPARTPFLEMEAMHPQGYFLSNGPGDPSAMDYAVQTVKDILSCGKPLFGICLGHQLLALAFGIPTFKMHHGHRGLNHPVRNIQTGLCEITTQNHGFGVDPEALRHSPELDITHINLNDGSIEGIRVRGKKAFSVQYHPESTPGPYDSRYLFDEFLQNIRD